MFSVRILLFFAELFLREDLSYGTIPRPYSVAEGSCTNLRAHKAVTPLHMNVDADDANLGSRFVQQP